jgi:[protein-PII] uridylyltransferase
MHFHAGKAQDVLDRSEQMRVAEVYGMTGQDYVLPVEQFMREYFHHSANVRNLVSRFEESALPPHAVARVLGPMFSHRVEGDFLVGPREISATRRGLDKLTRDVEEVLRLADLANLYNKRIAHRTWAAVHRAAPGYSHEITPAVAHRFLSLMAQPPRLGELLRRLHELGVLEKIIPAFHHARHLLQFNEYHKYTVDEHCIQAVECATEFATDRGPLGHTYRQIKQKRTLHLALLLHDLGKGLPGDHSDVGLEIATETAARLHLPERETEVVKFLVHKHLLMSHLAFRRDLSDERLIVRFAVEVGSPEVLRMLYVLTCADLSSVGPGVLNEWKVDVLTHLYRRTLRHLAGDALAEADRELESARANVRRCFSLNQIDTWLVQQIDALPPGYLYEQPADKIATALNRMRLLEPGGADVWGEYLPDTKTVEFLVGVDQSLSEGLFYRLTGALTSKGLAILSAHINSLANGLVLDRFVVEDPDYAGEPPQDRIQGVCQAILESIHSAKPPKFRQVWGEDGSKARKPLSPLPTEVRIDNSTSQEYTIIDVFTFNRRGLLYRIGRVLFELDLSIGVAKIGTYLDQVVDVFYVTDQKSHKIQDEQRLNEIRRRLLEAIELDADHGAVN